MSDKKNRLDKSCFQLKLNLITYLKKKQSTILGSKCKTRSTSTGSHLPSSISLLICFSGIQDSDTLQLYQHPINLLQIPCVSIFRKNQYFLGVRCTRSTDLKPIKMILLQTQPKFYEIQAMRTKLAGAHLGLLFTFASLDLSLKVFSLQINKYKIYF